MTDLARAKTDIRESGEMGDSRDEVIIFIAHLMTDLARAKTDIRESGETGDSREEEDTQWRQVITLHTRIILRTFAGTAYFVSLT